MYVFNTVILDVFDWSNNGLYYHNNYIIHYAYQ